MMITNLEQREIFHIVFLRHLGGRIKADKFALKGGVNLRLFFKSPRYSEDMDIDISGVEAFKLKDVVMEILMSRTMQVTLQPYKIERIVPPDIAVAKQTDTTQRFKVHLLTADGEDLFTKIEFSRRRMSAGIVIDTADEAILKKYKLPPLMTPHYSADAALSQKIGALAGRSETQARDIFDIYNLLPQIKDGEKILKNSPSTEIKKALENALRLDFPVFKDTVLAYLKDEDRLAYGKAEHWEEMQLRVGAFLNGGIR